MVPWVQFSCHIVLTLDRFHAYQEWDGGAGEAVPSMDEARKGGDTVDSERKGKEAFPKVWVNRSELLSQVERWSSVSCHKR
jgi:hypothetical protein